ncbi:MAG: cytochrome c [Acidimicrobiia bacterium]|nr:cytochrome c [Acidimicrobiia bacterium]
MSDVLSAAAAALGIPESLTQRSAEARAAETGASVEDILSAWAGGAPLDTPSPASQVQPAPAEAESPDHEETVEMPTPSAAPAPAPTPAVSDPTPAAVGRAPVPPEVTAAEAVNLPDVITVPTAGIRERTNFRMPRWLASVLFIAPLFALFALGGSTTGACGEGTELRADVVTGDIVNCDGSAFTGQAVGGGGQDFIALGQEIYGGGAVAGVNCAGCHGGSGQGAGNFPALTGVLTTFGACTDHIEWVTLGSPGFAGGTYGDTNKTVRGGMPAFAASLTEEQIAAVAAFERVRFGGEDPETAVVDCGLVEAPADDTAGDGGTDEMPVEGDEEAKVSPPPVG